MKKEKEMEIQFHIGKPELIHPPLVETRAFNERIQKIVVNADELLDEEEKEISDKPLKGLMDVEQEEEIERIRKEEEVHPDKQKNQTCL